MLDSILSQNCRNTFSLYVVEELGVQKLKDTAVPNQLLAFSQRCSHCLYQMEEYLKIQVWLWFCIVWTVFNTKTTWHFHYYMYCLGKTTRRSRLWKGEYQVLFWFYASYLCYMFSYIFVIHLYVSYMFFKLAKYFYFHICMIKFLFSFYVQNCYNVNSYYKKNVCILLIRIFISYQWHNVRKRKFWTSGRLLFFFKHLFTHISERFARKLYFFNKLNWPSIHECEHYKSYKLFMLFF